MEQRSALFRPPVEAFEDFRLESVAGVVLEDEEGGVSERTFHRECSTHHPALLLGVRSKDFNPFSSEKVHDFPIPHGDRHELACYDEDGNRVLPECFTVLIRLAENFRKYDRIRLGRNWNSDRDGGRTRASPAISSMKLYHMQESDGLNMKPSE